MTPPQRPARLRSTRLNATRDRLLRLRKAVGATPFTRSAQIPPQGAQERRRSTVEVIA